MPHTRPDGCVASTYPETETPPRRRRSISFVPVKSSRSFAVSRRSSASPSSRSSAASPAGFTLTWSTKNSTSFGVRPTCSVVPSGWGMPFNPRMPNVYVPAAGTLKSVLRKTKFEA